MRVTVRVRPKQRPEGLLVNILEAHDVVVIDVFDFAVGRLPSPVLGAFAFEGFGAVLIKNFNEIAEAEAPYGLGLGLGLVLVLALGLALGLGLQLLYYLASCRQWGEFSGGGTCPGRAWLF